MSIKRDSSQAVWQLTAVTAFFSQVSKHQLHDKPISQCLLVGNRR